MVIQDGIEPPTQGFSVPCSTDWATEPWRSWRDSNPRSPPWQGGMITASLQDLKWLQGQDLNLRPSGYEPDELPNCSTLRYNGGGRGIRTPAPISRPAGFQDRSLQPDLGIPPWWTLQDSNLWPTGYEPVALTNWAKSPN